VASCAPLVVQEPTQLTPGVGKSFRLTRATEVALSTGYSTTLRANTRWELVGTVTQGEVYRTKDQVVTLEGFWVGHVYGELVDEAKGQEEIADMRYTGAPTGPR